MVDLIGPALNQATTASMSAKNVSSAQPKSEKDSLVASSSPDMIDEVSISNEAMDIGRVMEIVKNAKTLVGSDSQVTLSDNSERLNMLA
jgi:hypothetical protein